MQELINTCLATASAVRPIAYYTHLVPVFILLIIGIYVLSQKNKQTLHISFSFFIGFLILWLIGDLVTWASNNYDLIVAWWSVLDYFEIVAFLFSFYFFTNLIDNPSFNKIAKKLIIILSLPAFYITIRGLSIIDFYHPVCEATDSSFLSKYRVGVEILIMFLIIISTVFTLRKQPKEKSVILLIGSSLLLLLLTFSITGYIAGQTGVYEILLFGLFAIPVFLLIIVFTISRLNLFNLRLWSQQLIAYVLVVLVASELFFAKNIVGLVLTVITVFMSIIFVMILTRSIKKESEARKELNITNKKLEESNRRLKELDEQKTEFISLASHQLRGPLTAIKGYASMLLEGDFGKLTSELKEAIETIFKSTQALVVIVGDYLDITRIEQGRMKYDFVDFDLKELVQTVVTEVTPNVALSKLTIDFSYDATKEYTVRADQGKIKQVISNFIDNATKYTKQGGIKVSIGHNEKNNILVSIKDTGVGITPDVLPRLFEKFSRAPDASKANIMGTGLGLYVARKIMEAHRGKVWAESEGKGKGSTFYIELEPVHLDNRPKFKEIDGNLSKEEDLQN